MGNEDTNNKTDNRDSGSDLGVESLDNSKGNQSKITKEQHKNSKNKCEWLAPYQFKPGQSGNPKGRKPGESLKEYAKRFLACMTPKEKEEFMKGMNKDMIWKMAEGNPPQVLEGNEDKPLVIKIAKEIAEQNDITQDTIGDSTE